MATEALDPISFPQQFDQILIAGVANPGYVVVEGFERGHEWDIKKGKGTTGGTITYVQKPPSSGTLTFYAWLKSHFVAWGTFRDLFKYDPTKKAPTPFDVFYPTLADVDINSLVCQGISAFEEESPGLWKCVVKALEYFPPNGKSAVSTPSGSATATAAGSSNATSGTQPTSAQDAQQQEIAALLQQAQAP